MNEIDISDIIQSIEAIEDKTERCIAYADVIAYFRRTMDTIKFEPTGCQWKDAICSRIINNDIKAMNDCIFKLTGMFKFNIGEK